MGAPSEVTTPEERRSPANVVFQFQQDGEFSGWSDGSKTKASAYLWVPETCPRLRGLLILCANSPEQMLAGHETIRAVCREHALGIVWCPRSFYNFKKFGLNQTHEDAQSVAFLQQLLDGLAQTSGYPEVARVPWLPIAESAHLLMADALVQSAPPGRTMAAVWLKNPHVPPFDRTTPGLVIFGTGQEWAQDKTDDRHTTFLNRWSDNAYRYDNILKERKAHPEWPLSYAIDPGSGHFECSEKIVGMVARYISAVAQARLPLDPDKPLQPVDLTKGYLADMPVPGHEKKPVTAWSQTDEKDRALPWFFDQASAEEAQSLGRANWKADSQLPAFADPSGTVFPFTFNGITAITLNAKPTPFKHPVTGEEVAPPVLTTEEDGITFHLKGVLLDQVPDTFVGSGAGEKLAKTPGDPVLEWVSGCVESLGHGVFRLAPDRNWPNSVNLAVRQPGTDFVRPVVQPASLRQDFNQEGAPQTITFDPLPDVKMGTASVPLKATASSGLPVRFFVDSGPAVVRGDHLEFTPIPPKAKYPITVTVGAWQFGRWQEPKVKRAEIVKISFKIMGPNP